MSGVRSAQTQFGRVAAAYVDSPNHAKGADLDRIVELAAAHGGHHAVDVGTGVAHTLSRIAPHFRAAIGIDATREMLAAGLAVLARTGTPNALLVQADATALPIESDSVDVATSRLAAHHFTDTRAAFREIARVLRPGGLFVLVDNYTPEGDELDTFINQLERLRDPSHVRSHTVRGWRELLEAAGLATQIDSESMTTKLSTESWLERSQTPPDRAAEVRRRLRDASSAVKAAFAITADNFSVHKLVLTARK